MAEQRLRDVLKRQTLLRAAKEVDESHNFRRPEGTQHIQAEEEEKLSAYFTCSIRNI